MLKPTKHLNPEYSVLNISAQILRQLERYHTVTYHDLYSRLTERYGEQIRPVFLSSLSFLYLLGRIEYHTKTDSFEYLRGAR